MSAVQPLPAQVSCRVVANLYDAPKRVRHLLHCGHVVVCEGRFSIPASIRCPQCEDNETQRQRYGYNPS